MYIELTESQLAYVNAQIEFLKCRRAGMEAENAHRQANGLSVAYGEEHFTALENEYQQVIGHNALIEMHRSK